MDTGTLAAIFGWMTVINVVIYTWAALWLILRRGWITRFQSRLLGISPDEMGRAYVDYLAMFKIAIIMLNFAPYVALRIAG